MNENKSKHWEVVWNVAGLVALSIMYIRLVQTSDVAMPGKFHVCKFDFGNRSNELPCIDPLIAI